MVEVRETRWVESPLRRGGWWTRGVGRERVREIGVGEREYHEEEWEGEEDDWWESGGSGGGCCSVVVGGVKRVLGREAEQPIFWIWIRKGTANWLLFFSLSEKPFS